MGTDTEILAAKSIDIRAQARFSCLLYIMK